MPILSRLRGILEEKTADGIILFAGGIGFEVQVPLSTLALLPETGEQTTIRTYLHLREGSIGLFGFATAEEQRMFELLLAVSGVGPRSALNCLSLLSVDQLATAIGSGNASALQRVPGIGRKTADRIVLELRERAEAIVAAAVPTSASASSEVLEALMFYGYSAAEAAAAAATLPKDRSLSIEEQTLWALQYFAPSSEHGAPLR
ncbi:MAG TPA: Holliday junction branch migration protein RuvA [Dehalococcoidia bacterium]|nr:Holliday junction branch migration protein RuvA [Dehalococcoidia bacterium]